MKSGLFFFRGPEFYLHDIFFVEVKELLLLHIRFSAIKRYADKTTGICPVRLNSTCLIKTYGLISADFLLLSGFIF